MPIKRKDVKKRVYHDEAITYGEFYGIAVDEYIDTPTTALPFSVRVINRFMSNGITTAADLLRTTPAHLISLKGFGKTCLDEVEAYVATLQSSEHAANKLRVLSENVNTHIKSFRDQIALGDFSFVEQGEWSEENLKYVELLKAAFSVLGEEMVFDCIMAPEKVTPVIQMLDNFQDEMKPYIEIQKLLRAISLQRRNKKAIWYIKAFTIKEEERELLQTICTSDTQTIAEMASRITPNNTQVFILAKKFLKWCQFDLRSEIEELFEKLYVNERAYTVIKLRAEGQTLEQVGNRLGVTRERVRQIEMKVKRTFARLHISEIAKYASNTSHVQQILNLSDFDRFELTSKINTLLAFDTRRIKSTTDDINASLACVKRIRKKMERSSVDNYDEYLQLKSDLNEEKSAYTQQLLEIEKELHMLREQKAVSSAKLSKARSNYETLLKKQSINDISARALLAFNELQHILYQKSIRTVEEGFRECFTSLINKSDLIDGIHIDGSLNVLPYKNKRFKAADIYKVLGKNGAEYLIAQIGLYAYEVLQDKIIAREEEFELPVEVKQQLSAGEKQIFIMALYHGLSRLNKINVPYIVDTPFARIDKEHRSNILANFFTKLNGQILILSTDEEIVGNYQEMVSDLLSNTFVLNHTPGGNTEILKDTYFGGQAKDDQ